MSDSPKTAKRIPPGSLTLQFAGDLVLVKNPDRDLSGLFRRYEALFETMANMDKDERTLNYKLLIGLILTSHAKKTTELEARKKLFDLKNEIFFEIANSPELRRKCAFRYLVSPNFRVTKFCSECEKKNAEDKIPRHKWTFCKSCEIDRNFYNVLSLHHKFDEGSFTLFLSHDLIPQIKGFKIKNKGKIDNTKEEAKFQRYHYNVRNLDAFNLETVLDWAKRLKH